jgi:cytoskeletal protein RodZ
MLKTAREAKGLDLEQVEDAIHIRRHLLEALEQGDLKKFPSPVVTRGLIRNYAKYLDLNPIEALTLYDGNGLVPVKGQRLTSNGIEFMSLLWLLVPWLAGFYVGVSFAGDWRLWLFDLQYCCQP